MRYLDEVDNAVVEEGLRMKGFKEEAITRMVDALEADGFCFAMYSEEEDETKMCNLK